MRILLLFIVVLFANHSAFGQKTISDSTKNSRDGFDFPIVKNEVDEFEGSKKLLVSRLENWVSTKPDGQGSYFDIAVGSVDGLYSLYYYGRQGCLVQGETKISLLLENEKVVDLSYFGDVDCDSNIRKARFLFISTEDINSNTQVRDVVALQQPNINAILSSPVNKVRLYTSEGYSDFQVYDVDKYIKAEKDWHETNLEEATDDIEKKVANEMYSEFIDKYQSDEVGALFYKIPYDYNISLRYDDMETYLRPYLQVTVESYNEGDDLKSYYDYYKGHTKFVLMDMLRVLEGAM